MRRDIAAKLKSRAGESIAETLVALLISALALLMLAGAVGAATRVVLKSKATMTDYYATDAMVVSHKDSASVQGNALAARTYEAGSFNMVLKDVSDADPLDPLTFGVDAYKNKTIATKPVIAYALEADL